jgi:hypothetical protein
MRRNRTRTRHLLLLAAAALLLASCGGDSSIRETRPVDITGAALPAYPDGGTDSAVGMEAPGVSGSSFDGTAVEITDDGRPKVLMILAHW